MAKEARRHHYIPQCYLRGCSVGSGKHCRLQVANLAAQEFFNTHPKNVANVRDFNRIKIEGFKPDALEGMLANLEGEVATAIRNITNSQKFDGDDRNVILNLVALLAVRSPQQRENWRQFEEESMKQMMGLSLATKERWESQMRQMKGAGYTVNESPPYEDMVAFYKKDEYDNYLERGIVSRTLFETIKPRNRRTGGDWEDTASHAAFAAGFEREFASSPLAGEDAITRTASAVTLARGRSLVVTQ